MDKKDKPDPSEERNEAPEPARPDPSSGSKPENAPEKEKSPGKVTGGFQGIVFAKGIVSRTVKI